MVLRCSAVSGKHTAPGSGHPPYLAQLRIYLLSLTYNNRPQTETQHTPCIIRSQPAPNLIVARIDIRFACGTLFPLPVGTGRGKPVGRTCEVIHIITSLAQYLPAADANPGWVKLLPVMEIRKQKPKRTQAPSDPPEQPVRRERVDAARRRAARLNDVIEKQAQKGNGEALVQNRQQEIQQQLAQLRSEAVQARRLAEQINNLSREATTQQRRPRMSHTPTVDPGQAQQLSRRAADKSRASGSQTRFNPLHPSLELPPEQLIRLLGLEDKPSRRKHKSGVAESARADLHSGNLSTPPAAVPVSESAPLPRLEVPTDHRMYQKRQYRDRDTTPFKQGRPSLLLMATGIGILAGIAVSAYVFWWQSDAQPKLPEALVKTPPAATTAGIPAPVKRQSSAIAAPSPATTKTAPPAAVTAPTVKPQLTRPETTSAPPTENTPADDPRWRAAVEAQEQRLRAAAAQRLRERMQQGNNITAEDTAVVSPSARSAPAAIAPGNPEMLSPTDGDYQADEASTLNIAPEAQPESMVERPETASEQIMAPEPEPENSPVTPGMLNVQEDPAIIPEAAANEEIGDPLTTSDFSASGVAPEPPVEETAPKLDSTATDTEPSAVDGGRVAPDQGVEF